MKNTAFFIALFAQIGVDFNSLDKEEQDNIREVYKDHLNVKEVDSNTDEISVAIGVDKDFIKTMSEPMSEALAKEENNRLSEAIEDFTTQIETPQELFFSGFMLGQVLASNKKPTSIPQMLAEMLSGGR